MCARHLDRTPDSSYSRPGMADLDFQLLFQESPDVVLVLLPNPPHYTMVAATNERLRVTMTTRDTIGRGLFELFPDNPDDPSATGTSNLRASLDRVIATRTADTMAVQKYDIRAPDGTFQARYWSPRNLPVLNGAGEVAYIFHVVEDVTALVRAGERGDELLQRTSAMEREVVARSLELAAANRELRDANARLAELDSAKTAFFSNVSHEFRTPLTLMLGPLEDSLADTPDPLAAEQRARLTMVHGNALRLLKLVNALLDFSRLESGRLRAHYAPLDIGTFTADLAGMFESAAARAGISLVIDSPPLAEPVWVDRDMWEKIVPNLISNALKFTHAGRITVTVRDEGASVALWVADTGVGIPESELPRIFERFYRVAGSHGRTHEGTGIGLSLVRELVELHGGRVTVESEPAGGSTFRVSIPKGFAHLPPEAVSYTPAPAGGGRDAAATALEASRWIAGKPDPLPVQDQIPTAPRSRVVVVDDNADLREYLTGLLAPLYDVVTAHDGLEALEAIRAQRPDLVVSDVMMPNLDGFGLLRELRRNPSTIGVPVILLSARAGEESAIEGLGSGADDYLVKPFSARELLARVHTHLELARMRRAWATEIERANRDLEVANKELEAFSFSVSHDLRTPLSAVQGFSALLKRDYGAEMPEDAQYLLSEVMDASKRVEQLIEDLLRFSRLGRQPLTKRVVNMAELVAYALKEYESVRKQRSIDVRVGRLNDVVADPGLIKQVFANLISNAFKFTKPRAHAVIEIGSKRETNGTAFFVKDNGAGFDMANAGQLFGVFQRLHADEEFKGTGIGLSLCQRIVHRHGGRIWAEAEVDKGATFYFSIPD
jgi:signal transduction histidine kinase